MLLFSLLAVSCGPGYPTSVFESDDEGWTLTGNGEGTRPQLKSTGGNPAGNICGQDSADGDIWYFVAPQKYLGDQSGRYGNRLTFDLKQGSMYSQVKGRDVIIQGGGLAITINFRFTPSLDWTPYSLPLETGSRWMYDEPTGPTGDVTEADFRAVLKDVTTLRIRGEFFDGPNDVSCLDNVYFGRE